jgi:chorismate mutase/prephenate dehydratase
MAAEFVAKSPDRGVAAISSSDCAKLYGLQALHVSMQNSDNNYTRFICITKEPRVYPGANKITLILSLEHKPGSLYDVLAKLSALEINLLKLESCPIVGHDFEFLFFFEIEASVRDPRVLSMLEELERSCPGFTYLGNYSEG